MTVLIPCQNVGMLNESGWPRSHIQPKFQASRPLSSPPPRNRRRRSTRRKRKLDLWGSSRGRRHPTRTRNVVCVDHGDGHPDVHCFRRFCDVPALQFERRRVSRIFPSLKRKEWATFQGLIPSPWTIVDLAPLKTNIFRKKNNSRGTKSCYWPESSSSLSHRTTMTESTSRFDYRCFHLHAETSDSGLLYICIYIY